MPLRILPWLCLFMQGQIGADMTDLVFKPADLVFTEGRELKTDSRMVAKAFGKSHRHVLKTIENLECSLEFTKLNFWLCYEISELQNGKPLKFYQLTRDGAMLLIMGFTGRKALAIKEAFINAFSAMEAQLTLVAQYTQVCQIENREKAEASDYGRGLNAWKAIKRELFCLKNGLEARIQPDLFEEADE